MEVTVGKVVSWLFGIGLILLGITGLLGSIIGGLIIILTGVFLLPPVRRKIDEEQDISFSRWLVVLIFLVGSISGIAIVSMNTPSDSSEASNPGSQAAGGQSTPNPNLIQKSSSQMLPTLDDFESGWQQIESDDTHVAFYNVETETSVDFNVSVHESVSGAESEYTQRRNAVQSDGLSTESVDIGNEGFMYQRTDSMRTINIRVMNVVGKVEFRAGPSVLTPDSNARDFARMFRDNIVE